MPLFRPVVVGVAAAAWLALVAVVLQHTLFHYGSPNLDDLDYRNQAAALRSGHLTLSAATHSPFFLPYLTGMRNGRVIFTHQPLWPGLMALVGVLRLPVSAAPVAGAALCALSATLLVREIFEDRVVVAAATAFVVASPIVVIQSGTLLSYVPTLTLGLAATALMLRALRTRRALVAFLGGVLAGLSVFNRPFDALLFLLPVLAYILARLREQAARRVCAWAAAGMVGPVALMLAYNWAIMGGPLRFPYSVHPQDTIGFGFRASFGASGFHYGPSEALLGLGRNSYQALRWTIGGAAGLVVAAVGVAAHRRNPKVWILLGWVVLFPLGYLFFWTNWNISNFRLYEVLGPFYYLPSLVAAAMVAGAGLVAIARWRVGMALVAGLAIATLSMLTLQDARFRNKPEKGNLLDTRAALDTATSTPRLVLTEPGFPDDPYVRYENPPDLDGQVLYALDLGPARSLALLEGTGPTSPQRRTPYELAMIKKRDGLFKRGVPTLVPLELSYARSFSVETTFRPPPADAAHAIEGFASVGSDDPMIRFPVRPSTDGAYRLRWVISPGSISAQGQSIPIPPGEGIQIRLGFWEEGNGSFGSGAYEYRFVARSDQETITMVTPGEPWRRYVFPSERVASAEEDVSSVLDERVVAR
jgi:hypothetical protein